MGILIQAAADWLHFRFSPTQTVLRSALQLTEQKKKNIPVISSGGIFICLERTVCNIVKYFRITTKNQW